MGLTISAAVATTTAAAVLSITFGQRSRDVIGVNLLVTTVMSDIMDDLIPGWQMGCPTIRWFSVTHKREIR